MRSVGRVTLGRASARPAMHGAREESQRNAQRCDRKERFPTQQRGGLRRHATTPNAGALRRSCVAQGGIAKPKGRGNSTPRDEEKEEGARQAQADRPDPQLHLSELGVGGRDISPLAKGGVAQPVPLPESTLRPRSPCRVWASRTTSARGRGTARPMLVGSVGLSCQHTASVLTTARKAGGPTLPVTNCSLAYRRTSQQCESDAVCKRTCE